MTPFDDPWRLGRRNVAVRWAARLIALGLVLLGIFGVAAWIALRSVYDDLASARDHLATAESHARDQDLDAVVASLTLAERELSSARAVLRSHPGVRAARLIPGIRQNVDAVRVITDRAHDVTAGGRDLSLTVIPIADAGVVGTDGSVGTSTFERLHIEIREFRQALRLLGPINLPNRWILDDRVERAAEELAERENELRDLLDDTDDAVTVLNELTGVGGPRRWLIVAANAAEMRGAGGMVLSYAVLDADGGSIAFGTLGTDEEINALLTEPVDVPMPADYRRRYSIYRITQEFRNATISADFPVGAPILEAMYEQATGDEIDGVIQVDSMGLAHLLEQTGPINLVGVGRLDADNIVDVTLNQLYEDIASTSERQDVQGQVAATVFDRLLSSGVEPFDLLETLRAAVGERHLMVYSDQAEVQYAVERLGSSGRLPAGSGSFHLAVENFAGNKLDYYVDTNLSLTGDWDSERSLTATITVSNRAPDDRSDPQYVFGPYDDTLTAGQYRAHVILYLPMGTVVTGEPTSAEVTQFRTATESDRPVATFALENVGPGETATVEIPLDLPGSRHCPWVEVTPQPRIRPTTVDVDISTEVGALSHRGPLLERLLITGDC